MNDFLHFDFDTMGTTAIITMEANHDWRVKSLTDKVEDICSYFDQRYSTYREDSVLSLLRKGQSHPATWPADFQQLIAAGDNYEAATGGHFTLTRPTGEWDPTGLVKAKAIDSVSIFLEAQGIRRFSVNIGGDIVLGPEVSPSDLSRIAITPPVALRDGVQAPALVLDLAFSQYTATATSGTTERGDHIWSPVSSGDAPIQATVVASDIVTADTWATALVAGGQDALDRFLASGDGEAVIFSSRTQMVITPGLSALLATPHEHEPRFQQAS